jgi:hypothetical protein
MYLPYLAIFIVGTESIASLWAKQDGGILSGGKNLCKPDQSLPLYEAESVTFYVGFWVMAVNLKQQ